MTNQELAQFFDKDQTMTTFDLVLNFKVVAMTKAQKLAEEYVGQVAPEIFKACERAGITYNDEMVCHLLSDGFLAGYTAAMSSEAVMGLVRAMEKYLNWEPLDGWHFDDCTKLDDEDRGCTCGRDSRQMELDAAFKKFEEEGK